MSCAGCIFCRSLDERKIVPSGAKAIRWPKWPLPVTFGVCRHITLKPSTRLGIAQIDALVAGEVRVGDDVAEPALPRDPDLRNAGNLLLPAGRRVDQPQPAFLLGDERGGGQRQAAAGKKRHRPGSREIRHLGDRERPRAAGSLLALRAGIAAVAGAGRGRAASREQQDQRRMDEAGTHRIHPSFGWSSAF